MDRRRNPRVTALLPVRVWGVDAHSQPFMQLVRVKNISHGGAVVQGMRRRVRPGEILEVQSGAEKAQFRVVWVGSLGSRREGEIGIQSLPSEPDIWELELHACAQTAGQG
ncbi:MAG TPA: PilZ domain-containing protein [Terriglobia bacterium]|nr:PilZ domain-containing protein [Terriglobia bacterium]